MIPTLLLALAAAAEPALSVDLAPFPGGRTMAYSLCCDEGLREHVEVVAPALAERDLRASFFLIVGSIPERAEEGRAKPAGAPGSASWASWRELAMAGHELGNLSWSHPYLTRVERERWHREVVVSRDLIARRTGVMPTCFALPFGAGSDALREFIAESHPVLRGEARLLADDPAGMVEYVLREGGWRIGVVRGLGDAPGSISVEALHAHLDALVRHRGAIWIAPVGAVAAHVRQRARLQPRVIALGQARWELHLPVPAGGDGPASIDVVGSVAGVPDYIGIEARRGSATLTVQADVRERRFRLNLAPGPDPVQLTVLTR